MKRNIAKPTQKIIGEVVVKDRIFCSPNEAHGNIEILQLLGNPIEHLVVGVLCIERHFRYETSYSLSCICFFVRRSKRLALHLGQRMSGKKWSSLHKQ